MEKNQESEKMEKKTKLKIRISFLTLWLCSLTAFVYANGPETPGHEATGDRLVRSMPVAELKGTEREGISPQESSPVADLHQQISPLSNKNLVIPPVAPASSALDAQDASSDMLAPHDASPVFKKPSDRETSVLVDNVLSRMVEAGSEAALPQTLTYLDKGDYSDLTQYITDHPKILDKFIDSIQKTSNTYSANTSSANYLKDWEAKVREVKENLSAARRGGESSTDPLVEQVTKLYRPIAKRISEITQSFEGASHASKDSGVSGAERPAFDELLKNFSGKAREFILKSFDRAQTNLANGALSNPLESTAFAAETAPAPIPEDVVGMRKMTVSEMYAKGQKKRYQVFDSVYVGKDFIRAQKMLHPPANLHPYLKWLLYTRNLTPRMVENYLATREAVEAIYAQAKAGRGNIRYRDKVYGAFLPFAETVAGNYELVKSASVE